MKTKTFNVAKNGIVTNRKTGEILTVIGDPTFRQKLRFIIKHLQIQFIQCANAAAFSIRN